MLRRLRPLCAFAVCALAVMACDDDASQDPATFSSGVEPSKTVSALSDDEAQQFCDATERSFGNLVSTQKACELTSVFFTEDAASCRQFTNLCVQTPPEPEGEPQPGECKIADAENRMSCEETVEALEACLASLRGLTVNTLQQIGCGDAGNMEALQSKFADLPSALSEVPGCETIAANCPALFDEDEPMNMGMPMDLPAEQ